MDAGTWHLRKYAHKKYTTLTPCSYKEDIGVVTGTIAAAMTAHLPPGVTRTLYLCDDGNVSALTHC